MGELPEYKKVYETLRRQIADGEFVPGDLLPSENRLCFVHRVTRPTVRRALNQLVEDGFIVKHQGKGSIVKGASKGIGILSLSGTTSALGTESLRTEIIVRPEYRSWSEAFSYPISGQERAAGCIYFERMRYLDGVPLFFDITMLPDTGLPGFSRYDLTDRSLFDLLRTRYGIDVKGGTQ